MPLTSGGRRTWSTPDDSFWCCVGSGMETHAKHGESIWWEDGEALFVNLFIPSSAEWRERGMKVELDTQYPFGERVTVRIVKAPRTATPIALRVPGWCDAPSLRVNGNAVAIEQRAGHARVVRRWRAGDRVELDLPMRVRAEPTPDNPRMLAWLSGPVVLAADLGAAAEPFNGPSPALVAADPAAALTLIERGRHRYRMPGARPAALEMVPFFNQYDRRSAVYFPVFTEDQWKREEASFLAEERTRAAIAARTVDVLELGEMQPERDHDFKTNHSDLLAWNGRSGRQAWWGQGNYLEFRLAVRPGPMALQALYWGEEVDKNFVILVDGQPIATERRAAKPEKKFVTVEYAIPPQLTQGKSAVTVRFETKGSDAPVYEVRMLALTGA
jgi:hypothetical protein